MRIQKSTIVAFFGGGLWEWLTSVIMRAKLISATEGVFFWISGLVFVGIVSALIKFED